MNYRLKLGEDAYEQLRMLDAVDGVYWAGDGGKRKPSSICPAFNCWLIVHDVRDTKDHILKWASDRASTYIGGYAAPTELSDMRELIGRLRAERGEPSGRDELNVDWRILI